MPISIFNKYFISQTLLLTLILCVIEVHLSDDKSEAISPTDSSEQSIESTDSNSEKTTEDSLHPLIKGIDKINKNLGKISKNGKSKGVAFGKAKEMIGRNLGNLTIDIPRNTTAPIETEPTEKEGESTEESVTEENEKTGESPSKENTYTVLDDEGKICILANFQAGFLISELTSSKFYITKNATSSGKCEGEDRFLKISWDRFQFTMEFSKVSTNEEKHWFVSGMELKHNMSDSENGKKLSVRAKDLKLFKTNLGQAYFCPGTEIIHLQGKSGTSKVEGSVEFKEIQLQPFGVKEGAFSKSQRCNQVVIGGPEEPFRDETVPLAVGLTLALLTLISVLGFSIRRALIMRKVEYNSME